MNMRFLCKTHREHLLNEPTRAKAFWGIAFDTAQSFYDQCLWSEALPHIGCAFETSDIMLTSKVEDPRQTYELMSSSSVLLAYTLLKVGQVDEARNVYWCTIKRLERELSEGNANYPELQHNLGFLYRCVESLIITYRLESDTAQIYGEETDISLH
ncbi:MAG: hypothetical protein EVB03_05980 [SAR92 clade bacterium]|uniref:Tetratricopeptide repeat protein n=1 Tax=SAR92 clade bacterium TaxID=2315479 RepID=A0A520MF98_9GAMM|nr:MAG: hypothetical protein EVB03_05980 [SAR92 clade bacterium]